MIYMTSPYVFSRQAALSGSCGRSRVLCDDGRHQTQIITSRWDLRDVEVAYRMFERWRQENFFKYMREEFLLDALVTIASSRKIPPGRSPIPNGARWTSRSAQPAPS